MPTELFIVFIPPFRTPPFLTPSPSSFFLLSSFFPTFGGPPQVVLRRTIGLKKDEFFLNRKRVTKTDVSSLLESAGFSKSNPYYIVQQGKVNALCMMSDVERLTLLQEVAGTTVYDEKRSLSLSQMSENAGHREKIKEVIDYIQERLDELEGEKEELKAYQEVDRVRRALEYTLYDKELRRAREALDQLEHARSDDADASSELHEAHQATSDAIATVARQLNQSTSHLARSSTDLTSLESELTAAVTRRARLQLEVTDLQARTGEDKNIQKKKEAQLKKVDADIKKATSTLTTTALPAYLAARKELNEITARKDETFERIKGIYARQGRGVEFTEVEVRLFVVFFFVEGDGRRETGGRETFVVCSNERVLTSVF